MSKQSVDGGTLTYIDSGYMASITPDTEEITRGGSRGNGGEAAQSSRAQLRLTLVSNRNRKQRATALVAAADLSRGALLQAAANKLRLKKATRVFLSVSGGGIATTLSNAARSDLQPVTAATVHVFELFVGGVASSEHEETARLRTVLSAEQDRALLLFSCGEDYVGKEVPQNFCLLSASRSDDNAAGTRSVPLLEATVRVLAER